MTSKQKVLIWDARASTLIKQQRLLRVKRDKLSPPNIQLIKLRAKIKHINALLVILATMIHKEMTSI